VSLADALAELAFGTQTMSDITHEGLAIVLTATDLTTGSAVRFGSERSSSSRFGAIVESVPVALAVAASAAFPLVLPAMKRTFTFERDGIHKANPVLLADGGIYDNLGLTVLEPGRSSEFTEHVYEVSYIISCDAGRGELKQRSPRFVLGRAGRSFDVVHARAQNAGRARLHEWGRSGAIDGFVMAYLGMRDDRLPVPVDGLVQRASVAEYPTDFAAMSEDDLGLISFRGEQLVRALLPFYCPGLA
jgi:NTE family protein